MEFKRSLLVPYSAEDMFDLIEGAEHYPHFLPFCSGARILERSDEWVAARLDFSYHQLRFAFSTRNPKRRPEWLQVRLVEGPFKRFQGDWQLRQLGDQGCKITFEMAYEMADGLLDRLALPAVEAVSRAIVASFIRRAEETLLPCDRKLPVAVAAAAPRPITPRETAMPTPDTALLDAVRGCRLAEQLTPEQAATLAGLMQLQVLPAGHLLALEGTADQRLYVVLEGTLGVVKSRGQPEESLLATLVAGDLAHELGFLDGAPRYASLVATTDARVLLLERDRLESLLDTEPRILYRVMCAIVRAVHQVQKRLSVQATELANYVYKTHGRY